MDCRGLQERLVFDPLLIFLNSFTAHQGELTYVLPFVFFAAIAAVSLAFFGNASDMMAAYSFQIPKALLDFEFHIV